VRAHDAAQLEHRLEAGAQAQLERQPDRLATVALNGDALAERALGLDPSLDPEAYRQVPARQLVHGLVARRVRGGQQPG
jgi:hypothetical protein